MKLFSSLALVAFLAGSATAGTQTAAFNETTSEFKWTLKELNAELPADWSSYQFLTIELRSSTAQRFELRLYTTNGVRHIRLHPFARASISRRSATNPAPRTGSISWAVMGR
jgi:hypothetical protein